MIRVRVQTRVVPGRAGQISVLSFDAQAEPLDKVFIGSWREALAERNRRCERWAEVADEVVAGPMPETGLDVRR